MLAGLSLWNSLWYGSKSGAEPNRNGPQPLELALLDPPFTFSDDGMKTFCKEVRADAEKLASDKYQLVDLISYLDLTTLAGDDTPARVRQLVDRAVHPLGETTLRKFDLVSDNVHCAATCTYPARINDVCNRLAQSKRNQQIEVASVAGGFPSGQYKLKSRLLEIRLAVEDGATEIDTVINRSAALMGDWPTIYDEIRQMREICGNKAHLKTILATGELENYDNIYRASMAAILAGSDFIKTSTGKEPVNATLESCYIMCQAIRLYHEKTGIKIGFKPAGGISTPQDALAYRLMVQKICGEAWINPHYFRIGASRLLDKIEEALLA